MASDGQEAVDVTLSFALGHIAGAFGGGNGGGGRELPCDLSVAEVAPLDWVNMMDSVRPNSLAVAVRCGGALLDEVWVPIPELLDGVVAAEAERYVRTVLAPGLSIGTSPPANVLVGLSTWFWMEGWDGAPINVAVAAPWGATVNVELSLSDVRWDFGDGSAPAEGDLGRPYPEESQIQHVYTHRSTSRTSPDGAYSVTASIQIDVRYWYEGMGPFGVAPLVQEHSQPVVVRQLQAVLG